MTTSRRWRSRSSRASASSPATTSRSARSRLTGIAPAPRGIPQIEVTFDIDANGIVHVSAKDKGTGKEQSMTITGGSSLPKDDIERMVREAEEHAAEDKKRREAAEVRNQAETLAYSVDKLIKDNDDKLPADVKESVQADVDALKTALAGEDDDAVKSAFEKLSQSQGKIGEAIYSANQAAPQADGASPVARVRPRTTSPRTMRTWSTPRSSTTRKTRSNHGQGQGRPHGSRA